MGRQNCARFEIRPVHLTGAYQPVLVGHSRSSEFRVSTKRKTVAVGEGCIEHRRRNQWIRMCFRASAVPRVPALDPNIGNISGAMRNRCVKLNLDKGSYGEDDLWQLVYENSTTDVYRIEWILRIHPRVDSYERTGAMVDAKCTARFDLCELLPSEICLFIAESIRYRRQ